MPWKNWWNGLGGRRTSQAPWTPAALSGHVETGIGAALGVDGSAVASWPGLTGTHTLAQSTAGSRPTVGIDSGKKYALFDGVNDEIGKDPYTPAATGGRTMCVAFRLTRQFPEVCLINTRSAVGELRQNHTSRQVSSVVNNGTAAVADPSALADDADAVFVAAHDFGANTCVLYRDGVEVASGADSTSLDDNVIWLGNRAGGGSTWLNGRIYAWSLFDRALMPAEVALVTAYLQDQMP